MLDGVTHFGFSTKIEVLFSPRLYMLRNCPEELYFCWLNLKKSTYICFPLDGKIALRKQEHLCPLKLKSKCLLHFVNILVYWKCVLKNDKSWRKFLSTRWKPLVWYPFIAPFTEKIRKIRISHWLAGVKEHHFRRLILPIKRNLLAKTK